MPRIILLLLNTPNSLVYNGVKVYKALKVVFIVLELEDNCLLKVVRQLFIKLVLVFYKSNLGFVNKSYKSRVEVIEGIGLLYIQLIELVLGSIYSI